MAAAVIQVLILVFASYVMATRGIARTFVLVYVPSLIFFFLTPPLNLPGIPDLTSGSAVGYPVLFMALSKWKELSRVRWGMFDLLIALMMLPPTISVMSNNTLWDGVGRTGELFFNWLMPYFMARVALHDADARRQLLKVACICTITLGCMAAVEARLRPYFVSRAMEQLHIAETANNQVFSRYGLMRAQTSLGHPIDLGNCALILGTMILVLTPITGRRWNERLIIAGILGAGAMVAGSVSFTGLSATAFAFVLMYAFSRQRLGPYAVLPAVVVLMIVLVSTMSYQLNKQISEERPTDEAEASLWARDKVVQDSWVPMQSSGPFGGGQYLNTKEIGIGTGQGSVDNSYILFVLQFGWVYLTMWIILALFIGIKGGQTLALTRTPSERIPVAAILAGIVATFLAMYTVWFGFVYSILLVVLLGAFATMSQLLAERNAMPVVSPSPIAPPRGYPMMR